MNAPAQLTPPTFDEARALDWEPFEGDFECGTVMSDKIVTGRKDHDCLHCSGPIYAGERHRVITEIYDGQFHKSRVCGFCLRARQLVEDGHDPDVFYDRHEMHCWGTDDMSKWRQSRLTPEQLAERAARPHRNKEDAA